MRLLIFGASGFLGEHARRRAEAVGLTVLTAGRHTLPDSPDHRLVDLGADAPAAIGRLLADAAPDVVVNCAGATAGPPEELAAANVSGSYGLVTALLADRRRPRLVHLGSAAEYGCSEPGSAVTESSPEQPVSVYGVTKLAGTRLVQLSRRAGLDAVVLRVFNPVGRGAPENGLPGRVAAELRKTGRGQRGVRLGSLDVVRDFVDADDVADAVLAAAAAATLPHAVVNIGSGRGTPARVLVRELVTMSGYSGSVREDAAGSTRSPDLPWQQADIGRARHDLGWRPRRSLADSLADLWEGTALDDGGHDDEAAG